MLLCSCGVLTIEIEHVDATTLEKLEQQGVDCQPKASTIRIIQVQLFTKGVQIANIVVGHLCFIQCFLNLIRVRLSNISCLRFSFAFAG